MRVVSSKSLLREVPHSLIRRTLRGNLRQKISLRDDALLDEQLGQGVGCDAYQQASVD